MNAGTIEQFGNVDVLKYNQHPMPQAGPGQVLIKVAYIGVGTWDALEREGLYTELSGITPPFPHIIGGDGSGTVAALGEGVDRFSIGDQVYAMGHGFYAEYAVVDADAVSKIPKGLPLDQAGAMPIAALTAVHALVKVLNVESSKSLLIHGASGDTGHIAVQLAKRLGYRVLAVASGDDGVSASRELGADVAIDGRKDDVAAAVKDFAPEGLDAALTFLGGASLKTIMSTIRKGGVLAYPLGLESDPEPQEGVELKDFDLTLDTPAATKKKMAILNKLIEAGPFQVKISNTFPLKDAVEAQKSLTKHRVGKVLLSTA